MPESSPRWTRHLVYRVERTRTTWKLRIGLLTAAALTLWLTSAWWTVAVGRSLVCESSLVESDVVLVDNFDPNYLLFERARELRGAGLAGRVLVPVPYDRTGQAPNAVALGVAELMARLSRVGPVEMVPIRQVEPITLNAARDIQQFFERERIRSVIVVTPLFRSSRAALVYGATLGRAGVKVSCDPGPGTREVDTWAQTSHGVQDVMEQWVKLQYYRFYILPLYMRHGEGTSSDLVR